jgi:hypothetical protein
VATASDGSDRVDPCSLLEGFVRFFFVLTIALSCGAQLAHAQRHTRPVRGGADAQTPAATGTPAATDGQPALAPTGPDAQVAALRALMLDANFEEALTAARTLLARTDLSAAQRNGALETLATAQLATRDQRGARETLTLLYSRDPDHRMLDRDASPTVIAAFDRARESRPTPTPVTIESAIPAALPARTAPVLQVRLTAGADAVNELRLSYRQGETRDFQRVLMEHSDPSTAQARIPVLDGEAEYTLDWYVEALAPSQTIVGRLGDALQPLTLLVPRAPARIATDVLRLNERGGRSGAREGEDGGSLFGRWWFWTAVGVVALGGATAAYVLTLPADLTPCGTLGCGTLQ